MRAFWRLLGYLRPYRNKLIGASVMLSVSGALIAIVVSTIKPLVNQVLLGRPPETVAEGGAAGSAGADILAQIRSWIPMEAIAEWVRDNAYVQVPLIILVAVLLRGIFLYFGQYYTFKAGACQYACK